MRYETASIIREVDGKLSNLRVLQDAPPVPFLGSPFSKTPPNGILSRGWVSLGILFGDGKTSIRAGGGIFDLLPLRVEMAPGVDGVFPFQRTLTNVGDLSPGDFVLGSSPAGAFADPTVAGSRIFYVLQFNPKRNYVGQWNVNIQHQLSRDTTALIGYVGARGIHMWFQADGANMVLPTKTALGYMCPCRAGFVATTTPEGGVVNLCQNAHPTGTPINPFIGRTQMASFTSDHYYDAFVSQVKKRMGRGLQIEGSYTCAKGIDTSSGLAASD